MPDPSMSETHRVMNSASYTPPKTRGSEEAGKGLPKKGKAEGKAKRKSESVRKGQEGDSQLGSSKCPRNQSV